MIHLTCSRHLPLRVEPLERKTPLAVDVVYHADTGVLNVIGSESDDVIQVQEGPYGQRHINGTIDNAVLVSIGDMQGREILRRIIPMQPAANVNWPIQISTYGGSDLVFCSTVSRVFAELGNGNNHFQGGSETDCVFGGDGNDTFFGGAGDDNLIGMGGNDTLHGDRGNDGLDGWTGDDTLFGDEGNDFMWGGLGSDTVNGGSGNDRMFGDSQNGINQGLCNDTLLGGDGSDEIHGGGGNDRVAGERGADVLYGDAGADQMEGDSAADPDEADRIFAGNDRDRDVLYSRGPRDVLFEFFAGTDTSVRPRRRA